MPEPEQILGKLESYELFFTDKRLVYLNTPVKPQYMPVGNLVGNVMRSLTSIVVQPS